MGLTLALHAADEYRRGHSIIMPLELAKEICKDEGLTLHVSEMFMRDKPGAPLGRPIPDYSYNRHGPPMAHEDLKPKLAEQWGNQSVRPCQTREVTQMTRLWLGQEQISNLPTPES